MKSHDMKVIIPFSYYFPETCAGIFIIDDLMHRLAEEGIASTLYVPTPTRNVREGAKWHRDEYLCNGLIHIHRFRMYSEGPNPIFRAIRYVFCECYYLYKMLIDNYDVAFIDSTPPIQVLKLPIVKILRRKPIVYNIQDLFPDTLSGTGLAKRNGLLWRIGNAVAKIGLKFSDKIIVISQDIERNLIRKKNVSADKIEIVYNWIDELKIIHIENDANPLFEEFNIPKDKFRVVYAGNLGYAQNIDIIIDAAVKLKNNKNIEFYIFGEGSSEDKIKQRIENEKLQNLNLLPLQPYERVSYVYSLGDVCIVSCKAGLGNSVMPSKTWSILSCSRPVLASFDDGELRHIIESNHCGIFTKAENINEFVTAIENLSCNLRKCKEMGANGRKFILENLTKEVGTRKYVDAIKKVVEHK